MRQRKVGDNSNVLRDAVAADQQKRLESGGGRSRRCARLEEEGVVQPFEGKVSGRSQHCVEEQSFGCISG